MEYGQKRWNSAGAPISLASDNSPFVTVRLPRYGVIAGTIVDENDVGLPRRASLPTRTRGRPKLRASPSPTIERCFALPGSSRAPRSAADENDGVEYLPTFSKETPHVDEARTVEAYIDEETKSDNLRPIPGQLFTLSGAAITVPEGIPVTVTLVSDMGRPTV
jgi:hypothetical protein